MIRLTLFIVSFFIVFTSFSQNKDFNQARENFPFSSIPVSKNFSDQLNSKAGGVEIQSIINYDNNIIGTAIGNPGPHITGGANLYTSDYLSPYVGQAIDFMRFGVINASALISVELVIHENSLESTPVYSEVFNPTQFVEGWNIGELTTPYVIPANKDVYISLLYNAGHFTCPLDTDPSPYPERAIFYYGDKYLNNLYIYFGDFDFCFQALITDGNGVNAIQDISILDISPVSEDCTLSSEEVLQAIVSNTGEAAFNGDINVSITVNDTVSKNSTVNLSDFNPGDTVFVPVPSIDLSAFGRYDCKGELTCEDLIKNNNVKNKTIFCGDAEITIDFTPDRFPVESSWILVNEITGDTILKNETLLRFDQTITKICVDQSDCYSYTIFDLFGDGISASFQQDTGILKVYYNNDLRYECVGCNFGKEHSIKGLGGACNKNDISMENILLLPIIEVGETEITGRIMNLGSTHLTSFEAIYKIGDYTSEPYIIDGIDLLTSETYKFSHPVPYNFDTAGFYNVEIIVSNPNGVDDEDPANNSLSKVVQALDNIVLKNVLLEHFTSSTCAPCAGYSAALLDFLSKYEGNYAKISYPVNWPIPGDPYYTPEVQSRLDLYNVIGAPSLYYNGQEELLFNDDIFYSFASGISNITISVDAYYVGDTVFITPTISALSDLVDGFKVQVSVIENITTGNASSNGETEFHNVLMKMLPDSDGTDLGEMSGGTEFTFTELYDMSSTFVEEMNDLSVVVFVQNENTGEVLQSAMVAIDSYSGVEESQLNHITVYPNPFDESLTINNIQEDYQVTITNVMGQVVDNFHAKQGMAVVNTSSFNKGIYFIAISNTSNTHKTFKIFKY